MNRTITLTIVTNEDGTRCSERCVYRRPTRTRPTRCWLYGDRQMHSVPEHDGYYLRAQACIDSEKAKGG